MGSMTYDGLVIQFDDRVLTHIQIVIVQKLRRNECFLLSWRDSDAVGDGRSSVWLSPSIPLYFKFAGGHIPSINRSWIDALSLCADSSQGLVVTGELDHLSQPESVRAGEATHGNEWGWPRGTTVDPMKSHQHR